MADTLTKFAYQTFQQSKQAFGLTHKTVSSRVMNLLSPLTSKETTPLSPTLMKLVYQRLEALLAADWDDAAAGIYPTQILFDNPWDDFFRFYPLVVLDIPMIWHRAKQKQHQDFPADIQTAGYPSYYVQNFHHQTGGYLSEMSANLYDLQVELLFNGAADPMRRRILAPLKRHALAQLPAQSATGSTVHPPLQPLKILDVACGTGRTLKFIQATLSQAALYGVDLSPTYLQKANQLLSQTAGTLPQLIQANAEQLPYVDNYFEAVTSVFLFHELPATARQNIIQESFRVTKPGGLLVICDSIQLSDSPELEPMMTGFPELFHEPYYRHYITDNLTERLETAGFEQVETFNYFMSKYWVAYKPTDNIQHFPIDL